ncbi:MAG: hypothetical protein BWZ01_03033 [Deltaproteobacteria bacterium ADurb.BinA179]|nr:MAG: hypothetical protein BWZ01_03033 [Deltaproteobacteria bacterium ADurb.BinA179]
MVPDGRDDIPLVGHFRESGDLVQDGDTDDRMVPKRVKLLPVGWDLPEVVAEGGDDRHGRHRTGIDKAKHRLGRVQGMLAQGDPGQAVVNSRLQACLDLAMGVDHGGAISFPVQGLQNTFGNLSRLGREPCLVADVLDVKCVQIRIAESDADLMSFILTLFRFLSCFSLVFFSG